MSSRRLLLLLLALLPCTTPLHAAAQTGAAATSAVRRARTLYYTPVDKGLQSFRCDVSFDWKNFIQKASNQPVPEGDARLQYLQSIQLSIEDTLRGSGELRWNAPTPPPENSADSIGKIRDGMQQVWSGFFQSWNGFLTGDLVTPDANAVAESTPSGFHVAVRTGSSLAEEQFDPKLLLQSVHVSTPALDSTMRPSFRPGPEGLLVTSIDSSYRQPPSAPPAEVHMAIDYAPVNGFQLPAGLQVAVGPAAFTFVLKNCTVQTQITQITPK